MAPLPNEFDFLADPSLDPEVKKTLLAGLLEEKRHARDNALKVMEAQSSQALEKKKLWHNTPLMLALVGTISVFANGLVAYVQAGRTTSDTITLKQLEAQLKESEERSKADRERQLSEFKQQMGQEASEAEARRAATKEEREFAFKIIERELGKTGDSASRAEVLLFLVRAGILNSLNRPELERMAVVQIERSGGNVREVGIPPTLGREQPLNRLMSLESINLQKAFAIFEPGGGESYTDVRRTDGADVSLREPAETLLQLAGAAQFTKFSVRNGRSIWVKSAAVNLVRIETRNVEPGGTELELEGKYQGVREDPQTVVDQLNVTPPLAKLTMGTAGDVAKPFWVKGSAVSSISAATKDLPNSRSIVKLNSGLRQGAKEDVPTAREIINAHGGRIGLATGDGR
jgi:hypothetical protein